MYGIIVKWEQVYPDYLGTNCGLHIISAYLIILDAVILLVLLYWREKFVK